jgi:hypothetical protein
MSQGVRCAVTSAVGAHAQKWFSSLEQGRGHVALVCLRFASISRDTVIPFADPLKPAICISP